MTDLSALKCPQVNDLKKMWAWRRRALPFHLLAEV
jgi:hypothetical protein